MAEYTIKREDVEEEVTYSWLCPKCGKFNDNFESPYYETHYYCNHCSEEVEIIG